MSREQAIRIRVNEEERVKLHAAAQRAGLDLSSWLRAVGLRMADEGDVPIARKVRSR